MKIVLLFLLLVASCGGPELSRHTTVRVIATHYYKDAYIVYVNTCPDGWTVTKMLPRDVQGINELILECVR